MTKLKLNIYPNPNKGEFVIEGIGCEQYKIHDLTGRLCVSNHLSPTQEKQSIQTKLLPGMYVLTVVQNQQIITTKVIIE